VSDGSEAAKVGIISSSEKQRDPYRAIQARSSGIIGERPMECDPLSRPVTVLDGSQGGLHITLAPQLSDGDSGGVFGLPA
jgi:hypothetical protein